MILKVFDYLPQNINSVSFQIFSMMFHGRYIIMMNGMFAVYAGFLYNDIFSLSLNVFGFSWTPTNFTHYEKNSSQ